MRLSRWRLGEHHGIMGAPSHIAWHCRQIPRHPADTASSQRTFAGDLYLSVVWIRYSFRSRVVSWLEFVLELAACVFVPEYMLYVLCKRSRLVTSPLVTTIRY